MVAMRHHARSAAAAAALSSLALVAGCSGDGGESAASGLPSPSAEATTPSAAPPTLAGGGEDAVSDLSSFGCEPAADGDWTATGVITSSASAVASYEVTVVLAGADADNPDGRRRLLADLEPGVATEFVIPGISASDDDAAACQVQVVRVDS